MSLSEWIKALEVITHDAKTFFAIQAEYKHGPVYPTTELLIWGTTFITNEQQITQSVENNFFLEAAAFGGFIL